MLGKKGSRYCPGCQTLAKKPVANDNHMVVSMTRVPSPRPLS
jgi:hypothetical protein